MERLSDPLVEIPFFLLNAVPGPITGVAIFAFKTLVDRKIEDQGQIGFKGVRAEIIEFFQESPIHPPSSALVGQGRVDITIANNDLAPFQGWSDGFFHMLGPVGQEQEQLGLGNDGKVGVQEVLSNKIPEGSPARLAGEKVRNTAVFQIDTKIFLLGRFTRAFRALERNEQSFVALQVRLQKVI